MHTLCVIWVSNRFVPSPFRSEVVVLRCQNDLSLKSLDQAPVICHQHRRCSYNRWKAGDTVRLSKWTAVGNSDATSQIRCFCPYDAGSIFLVSFCLCSLCLQTEKWISICIRILNSTTVVCVVAVTLIFIITQFSMLWAGCFQEVFHSDLQVLPAPVVLFKLMAVVGEETSRFILLLPSFSWKAWLTDRLLSNFRLLWEAGILVRLFTDGQ